MARVIRSLVTYGMDPAKLTRVSLWVMAAWTYLQYRLERQEKMRLAVRAVCALLTGAAVCGILAYTVLGRTPTEEHRFVWMMDPSHNEFFREMFMNGLLYLPLGLALTVLIGPWSVVVALVLSLGVEGWQYTAGTGLAQGTDVLCNTLGAGVGALPQLILWLIRKNEQKQ